MQAYFDADFQVWQVLGDEITAEQSFFKFEKQIMFGSGSLHKCVRNFDIGLKILRKSLLV